MSWRAGIHGYAARWGVVTAPVSRPNAPHVSERMRFSRGCFAYDPAKVEIWFMHRPAQPVGRGDQLGLEIWEDTYGLAFAFKPPASAWSLVSGIAEGLYDNCSVGATITESTTEPDGVRAITLAALTEISICPLGACPGAICWHIGNGRAGVAPAAAQLLPAWESGRLALMRRQAITQTLKDMRP